MCAIFGLGFLNKHTLRNSKMLQNLVRAIFVQSMTRGRTSSGLAYVSYNDIRVIKKNVSAQNFINLPEYDNLESECMTFDTSRTQPMFVLGHCRLKTKGTELDNNNNHPIVRTNVVGTHNGCISNDDMLFKTYSRMFGRNAEVDSEIIFALIDYFSKECSIHEAIQKTSSIVQGTFSCSMIHRMQPHVLWLFRRHNPCDVVLFEDHGLLAWASEVSFIETATTEILANLGPARKIQFAPNTGVGIDIHRNVIYRFKLDEPRHYVVY